MHQERSFADRVIVPSLALIFGAILVLLLLKNQDGPMRVPYVVYVPAQPTCHETMVPIIDQDGQRVECPFKGQRLEPRLYGDRWFAKCCCALETFSGTGGAGTSGAFGGVEGSL